MIRWLITCMENFTFYFISSETIAFTRRVKQLTVSTVGQQTTQNAKLQRQLLRLYCETGWTTWYSAGGRVGYVIYSRLRRATKLHTKLQAVPDLLRLTAPARTAVTSLIPTLSTTSFVAFLLPHIIAFLFFSVFYFISSSQFAISRFWSSGPSRFQGKVGTCTKLHGVITDKFVRQPW
jgi:hypothetical protein